MVPPQFSTLLQALKEEDGSRTSEAPALILCSASFPAISRISLHRVICDTAGRLREAGIKPGGTVSLAFENSLEFVIAFMAVNYARAIAAPLNAAYKAEEHAFYLEDSSSKLLLLPAQGLPAAQQAALKLRVPVASIQVTPDSKGGVPAVQVRPLQNLHQFPAQGQRPVLDAPQPTDVALFLHTSGTTGRPKGVPLNQVNLASSLANIIATYDLTAKDKSYLVMPLFHVHGLMAGLLAPLAAGGTVIFPAAGRFTASTFWQDCCLHKATFYTAVPTIHQVLLARAATDYPRHAPPPLRFIRSCSSALAPATLEKLEATFGVPVLEAYAMTEASHQMCSNPLPSVGPRKPGTVGPAQGAVKVAILDLQNRLLGPGAIGEVCVRGPNVTKGYLNNPKANEEAFAGGWFHTGDQGYLDEQGYVTLTGRIKELINRGGEKVSPLEVDAALLSHPAVAEAVSFGAPDEKYGEVVAAAVVLKPEAAQRQPSLQAQHHAALEKAIREHCGKKLSAFKIPSKIFFTDKLPKTATGKIQRRHMVAAFMGPSSAALTAPRPSASKQGAPSTALAPATSPMEGHEGPSTKQLPAGVGDGHAAVAQALASLGVRYMFGVVGIPVTPLASAAQAAGIRFFGMRNEQAAGYAAAAAGFLSGIPAVLLTVSGPGAIHAIAGVSHAATNCWPMLLLSGSAEVGELGKGAFQELDQVAALEPFCKYAAAVPGVDDVGQVLAEALAATTQGRPGPAYVDLPSNMLLSRCTSPLKQIGLAPPERPSAPIESVSAAACLLRTAQRPLFIVGKGAAYSGAEKEVQQLANRLGLPVLGTSMGRGLLPDNHPLCVNAARSMALAKTDVAIVVGARLNWMLHFAEPPRWSPDVRIVLVDAQPSSRDASVAAASLVGDARVVLGQLLQEVSTWSVDPTVWQPWIQQLTSKAQAASLSLARRLSSAPSSPMEYYGALGVLKNALQRLMPAPVVISEGANTMDMSRLILPVRAPRTRLDAGTWGTMGVGLGFSVAAAAVAHTSHPGQLVVAVEGDSAFGFSGMELETLVRYHLPIVVLVMNNAGIYGGDRRPNALSVAAQTGMQAGGFGSDPAPTAFVPHARHDQMMSAFGGKGLRATSLPELQAAIEAAIYSAINDRVPALVDVILDPMAGVESGNVHSFNALKAKL